MLESTSTAPPAAPPIIPPAVPQPEIAVEGNSNSSTLTGEHILYGLILLGGLAMRFLALGNLPLAPFEAANSWPAWLAATATSVAGAPLPQSALLYGLQSWLFFIAGANDWLARLWPALLGCALVLLPWFWRSWLGRAPALAVALLFAIDPWLVAFGRAADGAGLAVFFGLLTLTALWQRSVAATDAGRLRWERTMCVAVALLLTSGVQAWSFLPIILLFFLLFAWRTATNQPNPAIRASSLIWFVAALLLGATGLLARPEASSAIGASLSGWIAQLTGSNGSAVDAVWPWLRLLIDQPLLFVFGPLGLLVLALWPRAGSLDRRLALFLVLWLLWGGLLLVLPGRTVFQLPMLELPLAIGVAVVLGRLAELPSEGAGGLELAVLVVVAGILVISGVIWLAGLVENVSYDARLLVTAGILLLLVFGMWIAFGFWAGWKLALKIGGLFFASILLLVTVRSSWQLNQSTALVRPNGFYPAMTVPEVQLLVTDVQRLSSIRRADPTEAELQVVTAGRLPDPVLGWNLREMRNLRWMMVPETVPPADAYAPPGAGMTVRPLVITSPGAQGDRALAGYLGSDYGITTSWSIDQLPSLPEVTQTDAQSLPEDELGRLRDQQSWAQSTRPRPEWLLYRAVKSPPAVQKVTLWATPQ